MASKSDSAVKQRFLIRFPLSSTIKAVSKAATTYFMISVCRHVFAPAIGPNANLLREFREENESLEVRSGLVIDV